MYLCGFHFGTLNRDKNNVNKASYVLTNHMNGHIMNLQMWFVVDLSKRICGKFTFLKMNKCEICILTGVYRYEKV